MKRMALPPLRRLGRQIVRETLYYRLTSLVLLPSRAPIDRECRKCSIRSPMAEKSVSKKVASAMPPVATKQSW